MTIIRHTRSKAYAWMLTSLAALTLWCCVPPSRRDANNPQPLAANTPNTTYGGTPQPTVTQPTTAQPNPSTSTPIGPAITPWGVFLPPGMQLPPIANVIPGIGFPFPTWPGQTPPGGTTTPPPLPTSTGTTPPPPPPNVDNWPVEWSNLENEVLAEVNARRAQGASCGGQAYPPASPLRLDTFLRTSARGHSKDMADQNYFSHESKDGRTMVTRIKAAGYTRKTVLGENIAAGNNTARATVDQWMNSPGHCSNIMEGQFRAIGIGYANNVGSDFKHYWTQNFGGE
jgi:uncharacterized protein YkwD